MTVQYRRRMRRRADRLLRRARRLKRRADLHWALAERNARDEGLRP